MWLFLLFVGVPIIEITLFIQVGGAIGLWATLAIVILTAAIGTSLMRAQGIMTLNRLQQSLANGQNPADPIAQGAMILVAGILLLTPGFFTDTIGFALLLPPVRVFLVRLIAKRITQGGMVFNSTPSGGAGRQPNDDPYGGPIDGEYTVVTPEEDSPRDHPSGWTKH